MEVNICPNTTLSSQKHYFKTQSFRVSNFNFKIYEQSEAEKEKSVFRITD